MRLSILTQPASVQPPPGASKLQSAIQTVSERALLTGIACSRSPSPTNSSFGPLGVSSSGSEDGAAFEIAAEARMQSKNDETGIPRERVMGFPLRVSEYFQS